MDRTATRPTTGAGSRAFSELVSAYYCAAWELVPSWGSRVGLQEFDGRLEAPSADLLEARRRQVQATEKALSELEPAGEGSPEQLDRRAFGAHLSVSGLRLGKIQAWRRDPSIPLTEVVESLFELLARRDLGDPDAVHAISRRIARIPEYLRAGRSRIDDPVALWVAIARRAVPGSAQFLREAVGPLAERHPKLRGELESAAGQALEAVEDYGKWVASLSQRTLGEDFAVGQEVLARLLREWHGLNLSPQEVEEQGWSLVQYYRDELEQQARRLERDAGWSVLLDRARAAFAQRERDLIPAYRALTGRLRERMESDGVLDLPPHEECRIVGTPAFLRPLIPTAAYSAPGPLDPRQIGLFFVTEPDRSAGEEAFHGEVGQHFGLESTCVHEAYPGHHVQLCWANHAGTLARQMADHIVFMEGWTLYCEQLMVEQDWFENPLLTLNYLADQLWRAYRMVIDVGIHTRKLTVAAAVNMLMEGVGFTRERAKTELNWYTQSPGVPMSYLLGKRETLALRERFMRTPGATPRRFHRWLLGFGSMPQRWLHEHLPDGPR